MVCGGGVVGWIGVFSSWGDSPLHEVRSSGAWVCGTVKIAFEASGLD